jgi:hypothetical protein
VFEYEVPRTLQVSRLILDYEIADYGPMNGPPRPSVWNWQASRWDEIQEAQNSGPSPGKELSYSYSGDLPDLAAHMDAEGRVRLRVEPDSTSTSMLYLNRLDLSAEGRQP